jgi:6-phosphogluconolactonase
MNSAWITLIIAGLLEVGWAIGIKYTDGFNFRTRTLASALTLTAMIVSMYLLAQAIRTIPVGTGYAIWTGIGALGAATLGIFLFHEPATFPRIACLLMLVAGIVGLKLTTPMAKGNDTMNQPLDLYIGGYGKGVGVAKLDLNAGAILPVTAVGEVSGASFVACHPTLPIVYSVSEAGDGAVLAFRREADGSLKEISRQTSGGNGPCHLSVHPTGKALFVANYGDGRVSMLTLNADGTFSDHVFTDQHEGRGPNEKRQGHAFAHSIYPHPNGTHVLSADLGCDAVFVYRIDFAGHRLTEKKAITMTPGTGPRHMAFSADGRFVYVVGELSNTVEVMRWNDAEAGMDHLQTLSTLPADYKEYSTTAEIRLHPSGRFLFATNRGHDSVAAFRVDPDRGTLEFIETVPSGGATPRGMEVDPTGRYLLTANQKSNLVVLFRIDAERGTLAPTGSTLTVEKPACVRFVASRP